MKKISLAIFAISIILMTTGTDAIAAEDILKIDKIVIFQIVIFIAAIFILKSILFKPLFQLVEKRDRLTTGAIEEANELRQRTEQIIDDYNSKLDEARSEASEQRNKIRNEAGKAADEIIKRARDQAQILVNEARSRLESERLEKEGLIEPDIRSLGRNVASRILEKEL